MNTPTSLYLDLLKRTLTRALFEDNDRILGQNDWKEPDLKRRVADMAAAGAAKIGVELVVRRPYNSETRENGMDWPARAETMIGLKRLSNVQMAVESVIADGIPGDLVETGVWRGGTCIFMRGILKAYGDTSRKVWVCDSFEGLPVPNAARYPADEGDPYHQYPELAIGVEQVKHNFRRYGMLDDQVEFVVGWFSNTLAKAPIEQISVLRLDGDMYESTMDALVPLYPKLQSGGYCLVDDYMLDNCRAAIEEYRAEHNITDEIHRVDATGVYWRKS